MNIECNLELNKLLDRVEPSKSVTLLRKTKEYQAKDPEILNLTAGEPDFDTPEAICQEAFRQMMAGDTHYENAKGNPVLRKKIAEKLLKDNAAPYSEEDILVTPGGKYAIYVVVQALVNPGDEVLWLTPGWVSYPAIVTLCGGTPVAVNLEYENDYAISSEQLEALTTDRTKLLILNYPNNPTGKILTEDDMRELKAYLMKHPDIYVISDEIYEKLVYDGARHLSPASDPELFRRVVIVNGFSKCCAMTGWRIGYLASPPEVSEGVSKIFQHSMSCCASFVQKAAIVALNAEADMERMRAAYEKRRNLVLEGLKNIPNVECQMPEGAFYLWLKFNTKLDSETVCDKLLTEAKIAGIPGSAYGEEKYTMVRFCYAAEEEKLQIFIKRLEEFCKNI